MGWGSMLLFGNVGQQVDIERLRAALVAQDQRDRSQDDYIRWLWHENQQLKLAVTTLVQLLASRNVISPDEVARLGQAIDSVQPPDG